MSKKDKCKIKDKVKIKRDRFKKHDGKEDTDVLEKFNIMYCNGCKECFEGKQQAASPPFQRRVRPYL